MTDDIYKLGHAFGAIAAEEETIPLMAEDEIRTEASEIIGGDLADLSYDDIVRTLTITQYITDLCVKELGDRGKLARHGDSYVIPSALPDTMFVKNVLTEFGGGDTRARGKSLETVRWAAEIFWPGRGGKRGS